jgi:hypothetical protein
LERHCRGAGPERGLRQQGVQLTLAATDIFCITVGQRERHKKSGGHTGPHSRGIDKQGVRPGELAELTWDRDGAKQTTNHRISSPLQGVCPSRPSGS